MDCELLEFNGEDDHVHILITVPPKLSIAFLVGKLKDRSSYFIRQEFWNQLKHKLWGDHLWSPSYCCVTCGGAPLNVIKSYIEQQRRPSYCARIVFNEVVLFFSRLALFVIQHFL